MLFHTRPLALVLALALVTPALAKKKNSNDTPTMTTAPVFLPYYNQDSWAPLRGSVLDTNETASLTTYTIFCPEETPPACDISLEFPFILVEGPERIEFHGTYTSTYIATLECDLDGTTAATCSGYSSYKSGYTNGLYTGPTEVSWTSTYSGSEVEWGVLTMAEKPTVTDDALDITATALATPTTGLSGYVYIPVETGAPTNKASGPSLGADWRRVALATMGSLILSAYLV